MTTGRSSLWCETSCSAATIVGSSTANGTREGEKSINQGHSANQTNPLAASDDANGCSGIEEDTFFPTGLDATCNGQWHRYQRTHRLRTGAIIWYFSGNVSEWVDFEYAGSQGTADFISQAPWLEAFAINWSPTHDYASKSPPSMGGLGIANLQFATQGGVVVRGGGVGSENSAGIFSVSYEAKSNSNNSLGFRCAWTPPGSRTNQ